METYKLSHDDIQFIAEQIMRLQQSGKPFNAETVAQEVMACLVVCDIRNDPS